MAVATMLSASGVFAASALSVVVGVTVIGPAYVADELVGVLPSVV